MFFIVLFQATHGREQLDEVLRKSFDNFYFWGITLTACRKVNTAGTDENLFRLVQVVKTLKA